MSALLSNLVNCNDAAEPHIIRVKFINNNHHNHNKHVAHQPRACTCNLSVHKTQYNPWLRWFQADFWTNIFLSHKCWSAANIWKLQKSSLQLVSRGILNCLKTNLCSKTSSRLQRIYWGLFQRFRFALGTLEKINEIYLTAQDIPGIFILNSYLKLQCSSSLIVLRSLFMWWSPCELINS